MADKVQHNPVQQFSHYRGSVSLPRSGILRGRTISATPPTSGIRGTRVAQLAKRTLTPAPPQTPAPSLEARQAKYHVGVKADAETRLSSRIPLDVLLGSTKSEGPLQNQVSRRHGLAESHTHLQKQYPALIPTLKTLGENEQFVVLELVRAGLNPAQLPEFLNEPDVAAAVDKAVNDKFGPKQASKKVAALRILADLKSKLPTISMKKLLKGGLKTSLKETAKLLVVAALTAVIAL